MKTPKLKYYKPRDLEGFTQVDEKVVSPFYVARSRNKFFLYDLKSKILHALKDESFESNLKYIKRELFHGSLIEITNFQYENPYH